MKRLGIIPNNLYIEYFKYTRFLFVASIILILVSIGLIFKGLNYSVDFTGGLLIEIQGPKDSKVETVRSLISNAIKTKFSLQEFNGDRYSILIAKKDIASNNTKLVVNTINTTLGKSYSVLQHQYIGSSVSDFIIHSAIISILCACLGIFIYVWIRFEWQYGIVALIALFHDVIISIGALAIFNLEFNSTTIVAALTILGYSINDTVVAFDQVRENVLRFVGKDKVYIINKTINDVLSRSISTSVTVALVLLIVLIYGGDVLRSFSLVLLAGTIIGTYSSLFLALPLLVYFGDFSIKNHSKNKEFDEEMKA